MNRIAKITQSLLLAMMCSFASFAQDCGCDYEIKPAPGKLLNLLPKDFPGIGAGSVICIKAGLYGAFRFTGFKGANGNPIVIKNCGGKVTINSSEINYNSVQFDECQYVRFTGSGHEGTKYGIFVETTRLNENGKSGLSGVSAGSLSSDFEFDHLEIQKTGFAGIVAKTDPKTSNCESPETQATFRKNFTLRNLNIHHNYIHNTGGEGMYIGSTWGYSETTTKDVCNGYAHLLENVYIHHNRIEQAGWDGFQVSLAHINTKIYNNDILGYAYHAAQEGEGNQSFGIALGSGTRAEVYNNRIIQDPANTTSIQRAISGINVLTGTKVYNNLIVGPGEFGVWFHIRHVENDILKDLQEGLGYHFINNTIVEPGVNNTSGIGIFVSTCQPASEGSAGCRYNFDMNFKNNVVINPKSRITNGAPGWMNYSDMFIQLVTKELRDSPNTHVSNNLYVLDAPVKLEKDYGATLTSEMKFKDYVKNDFHLMEGSVAIDKGMDASIYGVFTDIQSGSRPFGGKYDVGAYEYGVTPNEVEEPIIDFSLDIDDQHSLLATIFPNPTKDGVVRFQTGEIVGNSFVIEVFALNGEKIFEREFSKNQKSYELDLSGLVNAGQTVIFTVADEVNNEAQLLIIK